MSAKHFVQIALLIAAAACARSEDVPEEALEAADDVAAVPVPAVEAAVTAEQPVAAPQPAAWQATARGEGTALRLVTPDDEVLMTLACANVPRELVATVSGFARIPGDSRFSLSMGSAPIILVADAATTAEGQGVIARAPVPGNLAAQMGAATQITASYGTSVLGPYASPGIQMTRDLLAGCGVAASDLPVVPAEAAPE